MGLFKKLFQFTLGKGLDKKTGYLKGSSANPYLEIIMDSDDQDVIADELFQVGLAYKYGQFEFPQSDEKAIHYIRKAAEKDHAVAQLFTALSYMKFPDDNNQDVLYWLNKAAEQGEHQAMYNAGISYHRGDYGVVDIEKSYDLIRRSAERDYAPACKRLALFYLDGHDGIDKNLPLAKFWAIRAYTLGENCSDLLNQVITPDDMDNNHYNIVKINREAALEGDRHAFSVIGSYCFDKDLNLSISLLEKAAEKGDAQATYNMGVYYSQEKDDQVTANQYFEAAAKMGLDRSQATLAESYFQGQGVDKNLEQSWFWNQKAINMAYTPARFLLSLMCLDKSFREILPGSEYRGLYYLNLAVNDNFAPALELAKLLEQQGNI